MAAHRYWQASAFEVYGAAALELSACHLLAGTTRVDVAATLTANFPPSSGTVADLQDDSLSTVATWSDPVAVRALELVWDFGGAPQEVTDIRFGSGTVPARFPLVVRIRYSDDGLTWTTYTVFAGISWPGPRAKTVSVGRFISGTDVVFSSNFNGIDNGWIVEEARNRILVVGGAAKLTTTSAISGTASLLLGGSGDYVSTATDLTDFAFGTGDFTITLRVRFAAAREQVLADFYRGTGSGANWQVEVNPSMRAAVYAGGAAPGYALTGTSTLAVGTTYEITVCRWGTILGIFVNGTLEATATDTRDYSNIDAGMFSVGAQVGSRNLSYDTNGLIDNVRVIKGRALYTASYTPIPGDLEPGGMFIAVNRVRGRAAVADPVARVLSALYTGPARPAVLLPRPLKGRNDYLTGVLGRGVGRVSGTVANKGTPSDIPVRELVRLHRRADGMVIRETWSDRVTGAFSFDYIDELQNYYVVSFDHESNHLAVIADNLTLANGGVELMP